MKLNELTISAAGHGLRQKAFSAQELVQACLERIKETDHQLRAFITITAEDALRQAQQADAILAGDFSALKATPLAGIPFSIKDVIATKGVKTTACSHILRNYVAPYDATAVARLKKAGAVILGKTNCDAFAHGASTENSDFGASHNPWDVSRVPGGSSGGSAVSVAAQQTLASLGTDTGGSIRQPAAFCGITALKPTYGRVSRHGLFAMTSSTDCISPMARSAQDLAYIMEALAGHDDFDGTTLRRPVPVYGAEVKKGQLKDLTIGVPAEYFIDGMNEGVRQRVNEAITTFSSQGAKIVEVSLPHSKLAVAVYYIITPSEVSSNLARFDGMRYGYSVIKDEAHADEAQTLLDVYQLSRQYGFGDEAKRRIMLGTYALSSGYYDAYYKQASRVRTLIAEDFKRAFQTVDLLLTPTSPKVAFKIGSQDQDPLQMYLEDIFVAPASLAGLPAINLPCGFASAADDATIQLPVGLQLIAPQFEESLLLQAGYQYQRITDWHNQIPRPISV